MPSNQENFYKKITERLGDRAIAPVADDFLKRPEVSRAISNQGKKTWGTSPKKGSSSGASKRKKDKDDRPSSAKVADSSENLALLRQIMAGGGFVKNFERGGILGTLERHVIDPIQDITVSPGGIPTPLINPAGILRRGGDLAQRPLYAASEGARRYVQDAAKEKDWLSPLDDVWTGAGQGLAGTKKTMPTDVNRQLLEDLDSIPNPDYFPVRDYVQDFLAGSGRRDEEGRAPLTNLMQNAADIREGRAPRHEMTPEEVDEAEGSFASMQILGTAESLALDPLNLVGGGVIKATRAAETFGDVASGVQAVRNAADSAVGKAIAETQPLAATRTAAPRRIAQAIKDKLDATTIEISGGPNIGRVQGADRSSQHAGALAGAIQYRDEALATFDKNMLRYTEVKNAGNLTPTIKKQLRRDPLFRQFEEEARKVFKEKYPTSKKSVSIESLSEDILNVAAGRVRQIADKDTQQFFKVLARSFEEDLVKRPGIKLGDKRVQVGSKSFWTKVNKATDWARDTSLGHAFSFERNFPGVSGAIASGAKTGGMRWAEDINREFLETLGDLTKGEDQLLQKALLTGDSLPGQLGEKLELIKDYYDQIWQLQVRAGLENLDKVPNPNYAYEYYSGRPTKVNSARKVRKDLLQSGDPDWYKKFEASEEFKHIRPISKSGRQNFMFHVNDVIRQLVRQEMRSRVLSTYGVKASDLSADLLREMPVKLIKDGMKLSDGSFFKLPPNLKKELEIAQKKLGKGKLNWYLDNEAFEILERFEKWTKNGANPETSGVLRGIDRLTRLIKTTNTIPFPAYHTRNLITDYITGSMDGVKFADWEEVARKQLQLTKPGEVMSSGIAKASDMPYDPTVIVNLGGEEVLYARLRKAYDDTAGSVGFYRTEIPYKGSTARAHLSSTGEKLKKASQAREDWGRIAHFKHAMSEEYPAALKRYKSESQAWEAASQSAAYRTNKYHADYGALTSFENAYMKRLIPFYTYSRRMIPVAMEAMMMNPSYFVVGNKLKQMNQSILGEEKDPDWYTRPEWMNEVGVAQFPSSDWGVAVDSILPMGIIGQYFGKSPQESVKKVATGTNPLIRAVSDYAYNKDLYSGREGKNLTESITSLLRPYTTGQRVLNPGGTSDTETALRTGLGLPFYELNSARRNQAEYENLAEMAQGIEELDAILAPEGYGIYLTGQPQVIKIVRRDRNGEIIKTLYEGSNMSSVERELRKILE